MNVINKDIPWLAYDHLICKLQLIYMQAIKQSNKSPQLEYLHLYVVAIGLHYLVMALGLDVH